MRVFRCEIFENQDLITVKTVLLLLVTFFSRAVAAGETEVYYYAGNNRPVTEDEAIKKVEVIRKSDKKTWILTYVRSDGEWEPRKKEKILTKSNSQHTICQYDGRRMTDRTDRSFAEYAQGGYQFVDKKDGVIIQSGHSLNKVPLYLQGEIREYYESGAKKSISLYKDNRLVWNHNWLENGEKYLDTIFYSVDTLPEYLDGPVALKTHLRNHIVNNKYYTQEMEGTALLGFVIMENGDLAGVHIVNDFFFDIGKAAVEGFQSLPGRWKPAILDGRPVRYFMTFPINFIHRAGMFEDITYTDRMLFYIYR